MKLKNPYNIANYRKGKMSILDIKAYIMTTNKKRREDGSLLNQIEYIQELESIKNQIIKIYNPNKIILFGSLAKGVIRKNSDIDLCIIVDTQDKRKLICDIYINVDSMYPFDIIVYSVKEWEDHIKDKTSFAYTILKEGKVLHG